MKELAFLATVKYKACHRLTVGRDNTPIPQITMCQRRKSAIPLQLGPEHQHCKGGSYEVLVMPFMSQIVKSARLLAH